MNKHPKSSQTKAQPQEPPTRLSAGWRKVVKAGDTARRPRTTRGETSNSAKTVAEVSPVKKQGQRADDADRLETIGEASEEFRQLEQSQELYNKVAAKHAHKTVSKEKIFNEVNHKMEALIREAKQKREDKQTLVKKRRLTHRSTVTEKQQNIESIDSDETKEATDHNNPADEQIAMGDETSTPKYAGQTAHGRKPSMFADLNVHSGSRTSRITTSIKEDAFKQKFSEDLRLQANGSLDTQSANARTTRQKGEERGHRSSETPRDQQSPEAESSDDEKKDLIESLREEEDRPFSKQAYQHRRNASHLLRSESPLKSNRCTENELAQDYRESDISRDFGRFSNAQEKKGFTISQAQMTLKLDTEKKVGDLVIENERLKTTILVLNQKLNDWTDTQSELQSLRKKNRELMRENDEFRNEVQTLKSEVCSNTHLITTKDRTIANLNNTIKLLDQELEELGTAKDTVKKDNKEMNQKIIQLEQEIFESKTIGLQLIEQLRNSEKELRDLTESSKTKIEALQKLNDSLAKYGPVHIFKKKDPIDQGLANFLNKYQDRDKLKILFIRESEGVYLFGQRRVVVKLGKGDSVLVKVGGGFMTIKAFLEKFTPLEVDRIKRKNVLESSADTLKDQKTSTRKSLASAESSPVRDSQSQYARGDSTARFSSPIKITNMPKLKQSRSPKAHIRRLSVSSQHDLRN